MESIPYLDELVKEYLLFRGFTRTIGVMDSERKHDRLKRFHVDRIVGQLFAYSAQHDAEHMLELWKYLDTRFFSQLDSVQYNSVVAKLDTSLKRLFIVQALQAGQRDVVKDFFERCGTEMNRSNEWKGWFALPFVKNPEHMPSFEPYFAKKWTETFRVSLHNFLSTIFESISLPKIMRFSVERLERRALESELESLRVENQRLLVELEMVEAENKHMRSQAQQHAQQAQQAQQAQTQRGTSPGATGKAARNGKTRAASPSASDPSHPLFGAGVSSRSSSPSRHASVLVGEDTPFIVSAEDVFAGHTAAVNSVRFSPSGMSCASASRDKTVRVWDIGSDNRQARNACIFCKGEATCLDWDSKGDRYLLVGTGARMLRVWDAEAKRIVGETTPQGVDFEAVLDVAYSPTESSFSCALGTQAHAGRGAVLVYDARTFTQQHSLTLDPMPVRVTCIAYNHNGNMLAAAGADGMVRVFDMVTASPLMGWPAHRGEVTSVAFSHDETTVISAGADGKVVEWSLHNLRNVLREYDVKDAVGAHRVRLATDAEDDYFVTSSARAGGAALFSRSPERAAPLVQHVGRHTGAVTAVDWHAGTNFVLTGGADHAVCVSVLARRMSDTAP